MSEVAVSMVVMDGDRILLAQREDIETWSLPGGGVEVGETITQAAIREVKEETGLDVKVNSLVGVYSRMGVLPDVHIAVFSGKKIGGEIKCQAGETIDVQFFSISDLPARLTLGHRHRIEDAFSGKSGSVAVQQKLIAPSELSMSKEILTNTQRLPRTQRLEMFEKYLGKLEIQTKVEVGG